jgi:hypothetical protein
MTYIERFDDGPGGWLGWISNSEGAMRLEAADSAVISRSPWWIDYNHAPPGGGYLHLLFALHTQHPPWFPEQYKAAGGPNRFVEGGFPRDFTNARISVRLRGALEPRGAECRLLVQSRVGERYANSVLTAQSFSIEPEWSWQTIELRPDASQWQDLGSRHDRTETYGSASISDMLADVNGDIILVLFPLDVHPARALSGDPHRLRAGEEYEVDRSCLPSGYIMMDEIHIEFPT